jgi:hypothetical protein
VGVNFPEQRSSSVHNNRHLFQEWRVTCKVPAGPQQGIRMGHVLGLDLEVEVDDIE